MASSVIPSLGEPVPVTSPSPVVYSTLEYVDARMSEVPPAPVVPLIQSGIVNFSGGAGVTFDKPFSTLPSIVLQPTTLPPWNGGIDGTMLFYISSASASGFSIGYSGSVPFFDPMPVMWLAVGS